MLKKNISKNYTKLFKAFLLTVIFFISACEKNVVVKNNMPMPFGIKKIAVFTFKDMAGIYGENVTARCPVCGKVFMTGKVAEKAADMLTDQLITLLQDRKDIILIPASRTQGAMSGLLAGSKNALLQRDLWIETGRALGADGVIVGFLYRFKDRIGKEYSVEAPASVAFDIHLIRVKDDRLLWSGSFNETQQSLFKNLYNIGSFLRRKGRWITAREMAVSGLKDIVQTFPAPNKSESKRSKDFPEIPDSK